MPIDPALAALGLYAAWLVLVFLRILALRMTSGTTGIRRLAKLWSAEGAARALFLAAIGAAASVPVLTVVGALRAIPALDRPAAQVGGFALAAASIAVTVWGQAAMGSSWRIGVDPTERTGLVTGGPFAVSRNPIYAAMTAALVGFALLVPHPVAFAAAALLLVGAEVQTRLVEEPYLLATHGRTYADYASRTGRFVPGVGRLPTNEAA